MNSSETEDPIDRMMREQGEAFKASIESKLEDQCIFDQATSFHEGGLRCITDVEVSPGIFLAPTTPAIACYAFACELYLKSLLRIKGGKQKGHNLHTLFLQLDKDWKLKAISYYLQLTKRSDLQFVNDILDLSNAFVEWRYLYEKTELGIRLDLLIAITKSLHLTVLEIKPEWQDSTMVRLNSLQMPINFRILSLGSSIVVRVKQQ